MSMLFCPFCASLLLLDGTGGGGGYLAGGGRGPTPVGTSKSVSAASSSSHPMTSICMAHRCQTCPFVAPVQTVLRRETSFLHRNRKPPEPTGADDAANRSKPTTTTTLGGTSESHLMSGRSAVAYPPRADVPRRPVSVVVVPPSASSPEAAPPPPAAESAGGGALGPASSYVSGGLSIVPLSDTLTQTTTIRCVDDRCPGTEAAFAQVQLRSADEGTTIFYKCLTCHSTWRLDG